MLYKNIFNANFRFSIKNKNFTHILVYMGSFNEHRTVEGAGMLLIFVQFNFVSRRKCVI